jgi:hypothetical protein
VTNRWRAVVGPRLTGLATFVVALDRPSDLIARQHSLPESRHAGIPVDVDSPA